MRKLIVLEHITLDGVIQAPGGPDEDTSGGFAYGGWIAPYADPILGTLLRKQMNLPFDLLLGRITYDIWAPYWPKNADAWPGVNAATKYVASNSMTRGEWQPCVFLNEDIPEKVAKIKQQPGPDLNLWGSGNLLQTHHQARFGGCVLADDLSANAGQRKALVCQRHDPGRVQGDGK